MQLFMCRKEIKGRKLREERKTGLDSCLGLMGGGTSPLIAGCPPSPFAPKLFDSEGTVLCKTLRYVIEGIL